jgi:hypothetical protein
MATFLIDCGTGGELAELGRRVVSYLGPDAVLGRTSDLVYGGVDARSSGAEVFIGLQATGATGTETWVHPRSDQRSRMLADTIQSEMWRYGGRGTTRTGDLSALAPERHSPGAAACILEVDDRVRHTRDGAALDGMAQAIARAARGARYGGAARAQVRAFDAAAAPVDDPMLRPFYDLVSRSRSDGAYRERVIADPVGALRDLGVEVPPDLQEAMATHLRDTIRGQVASAQSWSRGLEAPQVEVYARPWGVVIALNSQATTDLANGSNAIAGVLAMVTAVCGASGNVPCAAVTGIIGGYLWAMASVISLMNRGNGVYLTIPWTSFLPPPLGVPLVIPTPR